jgi:hypothetical protein
LSKCDQQQSLFQEHAQRVTLSEWLWQKEMVHKLPQLLPHII